MDDPCGLGMESKPSSLYPKSPSTPSPSCDTVVYESEVVRERKENGDFSVWAMGRREEEEAAACAVRARRRRGDRRGLTNCAACVPECCGGTLGDPSGTTTDKPLPLESKPLESARAHAHTQG